MTTELIKEFSKPERQNRAISTQELFKLKDEIVKGNIQANNVFGTLNWVVGNLVTGKTEDSISQFKGVKITDQNGDSFVLVEVNRDYRIVDQERVLDIQREKPIALEIPSLEDALSGKVEHNRHFSPFTLADFAKHLNVRIKATSYSLQNIAEQYQKMVTLEQNSKLFEKTRAELLNKYNIPKTAEHLISQRNIDVIKKTLNQSNIDDVSLLFTNGLNRVLLQTNFLESKFLQDKYIPIAEKVGDLIHRTHQVGIKLKDTAIPVYGDIDLINNHLTTLQEIIEKPSFQEFIKERKGEMKMLDMELIKEYQLSQEGLTISQPVFDEQGAKFEIEFKGQKSRLMVDYKEIAEHYVSTTDDPIEDYYDFNIMLQDSNFESNDNLLSQVIFKHLNNKVVRINIELLSQDSVYTDDVDKLAKEFSTGENVQLELSDFRKKIINTLHQAYIPNQDYTPQQSKSRKP